MLPKFATNAVNFVHHGQHLSRLAAKLPGRILRAAIRDTHRKLAEIQQAVDLCWLRLEEVIKNDGHWNKIVLQKDALFFRATEHASQRLCRKFDLLLTPTSACPCATPSESRLFSPPCSKTSGSSSTTYLSCRLQFWRVWARLGTLSKPSLLLTIHLQLLLVYGTAYRALHRVKMVIHLTWIDLFGRSETWPNPIPIIGLL